VVAARKMPELTHVKSRALHSLLLSEWHICTSKALFMATESSREFYSIKTVSRKGALSNSRVKELNHRWQSQRRAIHNLLLSLVTRETFPCIVRQTKWSYRHKKSWRGETTKLLFARTMRQGCRELEKKLMATVQLIIISHIWTLSGQYSICTQLSWLHSLLCNERFFL
jgi:hypothetical protein